MDISNYRFIETTKKFYLINKFMYSNIFKITEIDKLILNSEINELSNSPSIACVKSLILLELLCGQRSYVSSFRKILKGKGLYQFHFSAKVTIRKLHMFNFLFFFMHYSLEVVYEKFQNVEISWNTSSDMLFIKLRNVFVLPGLIEIYFRWPHVLQGRILFNNNNSLALDSEIILKYFGINFNWYTEALAEKLKLKQIQEKKEQERLKRRKEINIKI